MYLVKERSCFSFYLRMKSWKDWGIRIGMKVKRIITISISLLFIVSVAMFIAFMPVPRRISSTNACHGQCGRTVHERDPRVCCLDEPARGDEWWVSRSDEFPESTFVVNAVPVAVDHEADGMVYFGSGFGGLSQSDTEAVAWFGTLKEGMCVRLGR